MNKINFSISNSEINAVQRLVLCIGLFMPVLALIILVNLCIDPANLYRIRGVKSDEYAIAQALASGKNVELYQHIDDRQLQKYFVEALPKAPDIVVLGTSQVMWIGNNIFPEKYIVNNSVSDGFLADYLGIFNGYAKRGIYPKRVICLVSPATTTFPTFSNYWLSIKEETKEMLDRLEIRTGHMNTPLVHPSFFNIFSLSYFQQSLGNFNRKKVKSFLVDHEIAGRGEEFIFKEGRRLWTTELLRWGTGNSRRKTFRELYHKSYIQSKNGVRPDKELERILETFLRYLIDHHVKVTIYMLPFSPEQYKSFIAPSEGRGTLDIKAFEAHNRQLAKRLNVDIVGSYDPAVCGLSEKDFYDGDHIRNGMVEKILTQKDSKCLMPDL